MKYRLSDRHAFTLLMPYIQWYLILSNWFQTHVHVNVYFYHHCSLQSIKFIGNFEILTILHRTVVSILWYYSWDYIARSSLMAKWQLLNLVTTNSIVYLIVRIILIKSVSSSRLFSFTSATTTTAAICYHSNNQWQCNGAIPAPTHNNQVRESNNDGHWYSSRIRKCKSSLGINWN